MKKYIRTCVCAAALTTSGVGVASAQNSDTVQVSMDVQFTRSVELGFDGNLAIDAANSITQIYYDEFGNPNGDSQQIHVGYVEGCVHVQGVDRVNVSFQGSNPDPLGAGPYLTYNDGTNDYYLNYSPTLIGRWDNSKPFTDVSAIAFGDNPPDSGFQHIASPNYAENIGPLNDSSQQAHILGAIGNTSESGCASGNNVALAAMVPVRDGHAYYPVDDSPRQHFGSLNDLAGNSSLAADTQFSFSDQITIEITPDLS